jgi:hypothetical protein
MKKNYGYVLLLIDDGDSNFMQFHYRLILHQGPSKFYIIYNSYNLTVFDGLSNDNEIIRNLNYHQSINRRTYP